MTRQKRIILDFINNTKVHPTADEIYHHAKKIIPSIAIGTVYRNLHYLHESGEIRRIEIPNAPDRYDRADIMHDHIICVNCNRLFDISRINLDQIIESKVYTPIISYDLIIRSICPSCMESNKEKSFYEPQDNV